MCVIVGGMGMLAFILRPPPSLLASLHPVAYLCNIIGVVQLLCYFSLVPSLTLSLQRDVLRLAKPVQSIVLPSTLVLLRRACGANRQLWPLHLRTQRASLRLLWDLSLQNSTSTTCTSVGVLFSIAALPRPSTSFLLSLLLPCKMIQYTGTFPH